MWVEDFFNENYKEFLKKTDEELIEIDKKISYFIDFNILNNI